MANFFVESDDYEEDDNYNVFEEMYGGDSGEESTVFSNSGRLLSAVELRLEKANCYKALLGASLLDGPPVAAEVEEEVQGFIRHRLSILMGLEQEKPREVAQPSPFTPEEIQVLKKLVQQVLSRPPEPTVQTVQVKPTEAPLAAPKPVSVTPPAITPAPQLAVPAKRGPGRPKGSKNKPKTVSAKTTKKPEQSLSKKKQTVSTSVARVPLASNDVANVLAAQQGAAGLIAEGSDGGPEANSS